ncbi:MAG: hypothetical protein ACK5IJ_02820 [Mangrovibacterium sp.]
MKKYFSIFVAVCAMSFISSCTDETYVVNDYYFEGIVNEYECDLLWNSEVGAFASYVEFQSSMLDTDVLLVYLLWENIDGLDVWRPLPQTTYTEFGPMTYSYDFTMGDATFYLTTSFDPNEVNDADIYRQIFRTVAVPASFVLAHQDVVKNYDSLMTKLEDSDVSFRVVDVK